MSKFLRATFLVHAVVCVLFGAAMLLAPGRFLTAFGWAPIDPILSRVLGAAFLGLAWGSFRGSRAIHWSEVVILVQLEAVFTVLACVGLLRHLLFARYPLAVWGDLVVFAVFAVAWVYFLVRNRGLD